MAEHPGDGEARSRPCPGFVPSALPSGSAMMARRATSLSAICCGEWRSVAAIATTALTQSGKSAAQASACIPPIDPPATAASERMPRRVSSSRCTRTMSQTVNGGKSGPNALPVAGSTDAGPVVP